MKLLLVALLLPFAAMAQPSAVPQNPRAEAIKRDMCAHASFEDTAAGRAIKARDCGSHPTFEDLHPPPPKK